MIANALKRPADSELALVCLVPFGEWQGHPMGAQSYGPDECQTMLDNWQRMYAANGKPMPIDYGHDSLYRGDAPAAGWCWSVELGAFPDENGNEVEGLWGRVEWTPRANDGIKAKEFSGAISPVIDTGSVDPVSGVPQGFELFNAALTNQPFMLDSMPQAPANMRVFTNGRTYLFSRITNEGGPMDPKQMLADAAAALGLPATAAGDEVLNLVKKLVEFVGMLPGAPAGGGMPPDMGEMETEMKKTVACSKALGEIASLLKVDPENALAEVAKIRNSRDAAPTREEVDALKTKLAERDADDLIANSAAKIKPDDRDFWRNKAIADLKGTTEIIAKLPDVMPNNRQEPTTKTRAEVPDEVTQKYRRELGTQKIHDKNKEK